MRAARGALLAVMLAFGSGVASAAEVIVNEGRTEETVTRAYLRALFGMRVRAWSDGTPVQVFVLPDDHPLHAEFCAQVLKMYPYQLRQNWDRLVYSGTGQRPIEVPTAEELARRVAETPGAIGYRAEPRVKVLHVK